MNGVNGQNAPWALLLVVRVKVKGRDTQFLQEKSVKGVRRRHVTLIRVTLIASMSGLTGPVANAARVNRPERCTSPFQQNMEDESVLRTWRMKRSVMGLNVLLTVEQDPLEQ